MEKNTNSKEIKAEEEIKKTEPVLQEKQTTKAEEEPETTSHVKTESAKKITFCICLSLSIVLAIFLVLSTIFALLNVNNTRILSGIYIDTVNVSGLTKEEAKEALSNALNNNLALTIRIYNGDYETSFLPEQIEAKFDIDAAIDAAYRIGRDGSFIQNNYTILFTLLEPVSIQPTLQYNEEALNSIASSIAEKLPDKVIEPS